MVGATPKKVVLGKQAEQDMRSKANKQPPSAVSASPPVSTFLDDELQPRSQINPFWSVFIIATKIKLGYTPTPIGEEFLKGVGGNIYVFLQEHPH